MSDLSHAESVALSAVTIDDEFWSRWIEQNREVTIEYQYEQLEESGTLENFRRARDVESGDHRGMWFQDSDAYKWIEAASYVLTTENDPELVHRVDEVIDLIAAAQEDSGYLNTYYVLEEPDRRWTNLNMGHELYCGGHLIEAAVAHYRATGETSLLDVATAFADHVDKVFPDEVDAPPGHQEIELALVKLARVTGEQRYVDLAKYFVDRRGRTDRFEWELEHPEEVAGYDPDAEEDLVDGARSVFFEGDEYDGQYAQDHAPLDEQTAVEGHSVRAMYYFASVADVAAETGEAAYVDHLERLWENMTRKRMYVTGGIGSAHHGERFTEDYDLPNDTAYAETCAAIGSIFWSRRMFELTGEARYHDLIERTLYNGFLAGVSLDGTEFFYDNRLASDGDVHRSGWFECACCPPNVARLFASLERYLYATADDALYVNQYVASTGTVTVDSTEVELDQASGLPWNGDVTVGIETAEPTEFTVNVRVPEWCDDIAIEVNGESVASDSVERTDDGYVAVTREWTDDEIAVTFDMTVEALRSHPAVRANAGRVALRRGPVVYCLEAVDNDRPLHQYAVDPDGEFESAARDDLLDGVVTVDGDALVPSLDGWDDELYRPATEPDEEPARYTAVPYYGWDNRESGAMRVWLRSV